MNRAVLVVTFCAMVLATISYAEGASRRELAEKLLEAMDVQKNIEKSFEMVNQMIPADLKHMGDGENSSSNRAKKEMAEMMEVIMKEMSWDKLKDDYISIYADTFTEKELLGIIKFYESPIGQKFIEKQPELMKKSMQISQKQMIGLAPKIQKLTEEMRNRIKVP